jgi:RHS repeat-associated protein
MTAVDRSKLLEFDAGVVQALMQARYQNSSRGQFISEDPVFWEVGQTKDGMNILWNPQSLNSYAYANDNPITGKDPDGRLGEQALPVVASAAIVLVAVYPYLTPSQQQAVGRAVAALGQLVQSIGRSIGGGGVGSSYPIGVRSAPYTNTNVTTNTTSWTNINLSKKDNDQYGSLPTPSDLTGKTSDQIDQIMKDKGIPGQASRGGGTRYPVPGRSGDQVRIENGNPNDPNPVKQGPYGRVSQDGNTSDPFPLNGNPTLNQ